MDIELNGKDFPNIFSYLNNGNPTLRSPSSVYEISLMQTKETLADIDSYARFINNAISQFRHSRFYKAYKANLMSLGLDHCAYLHNINSEMAELEMNHVILTIFDIALMISEHYLNTYGYVSTFHIVGALREEHKQNRVPIIMMSKTVHQLYHNDDLFYVHPNQVFGKWTELIKTYYNGITPEICSKLLYYIRLAQREKESNDDELLTLGNEIQNWSERNYGSTIHTIESENPYYFWNTSNSNTGNCE
jgi:hypothetical protein